MSFEKLSTSGLNYAPCRYGESKVPFRGPKRDISKPYGVVLGGTEAYGKFVIEPFAAKLEGITGQQVVNLGVINGGMGFYNNDSDLSSICRKADFTIVHLTGAQFISNRFYAVHPRRNDRLVKPSKFLTSLYRDVDFSQFTFVGHMLQELRVLSPERFALVQEELREAWLARMRDLMAICGGRKVLLWLANRTPGAADTPLESAGGPAFVNHEMVEAACAFADDYLEIVATHDEIAAGFGRMVFSDIEEPVAREMLGPVVHDRVASALCELLYGLVPVAD